MRTSRIILALGAILLAASLAALPAQARPKPKPSYMSDIVLQEVTQSGVDGYVFGLGPCEIKRPVVLLRQGDRGAKVVERTTTEPNGDFTLEYSFNQTSFYQLVAPAVKRKRFVCRASTSRFIGFFN